MLRTKALADLPKNENSKKAREILKQAPKRPQLTPSPYGELFGSFFKTLTNQTVTIELKNDIRIRGTLKSVDQYLNIKLDDVDVLDLDKYPHLSSVKNMFIRGSVVRYVMLPRSEVDIGLLEDATRREAANQAGKAR
ncbi:U6 snRNA-associated Sm-like protein LSm2 [Aspergillus niger]|nr:U6 snRNA-associated Sm-like protein LSm2 [Aspergillus niger]